GKTKTLVLCEHPRENKENLIFEPVDFDIKLLEETCEILYRHEIQSVIVEGGSKTLQSFIDAGIWDEARVFTGKKEFGLGTKAPTFTGKISSEEKIGMDVLQIYF